MVRNAATHKWEAYNDKIEIKPCLARKNTSSQIYVVSLLFGIFSYLAVRKIKDQNNFYLF